MSDKKKITVPHEHPCAKCHQPMRCNMMFAGHYEGHEAEYCHEKCPEDIKPLPPTNLVKVTCSSCDHPFITRSSEAFEAAREDHLAWKHRKLSETVKVLMPPEQVAALLLSLAPDGMEYLPGDTDEEK
jgi:hypothetical protein